MEVETGTGRIGAGVSRVGADTGNLEADTGKLEAGTSRVEAENRLLHRAIEVIASSLSLDDALHATVDLVTEATGGDLCIVHLWDRATERLVLRAASEGFRDGVGRVTLASGEGIAGWVAEHREVVVIPENKWGDPRYKYIPELKGELFESMLSVPVISRSDDLLGVFNVHSRARKEFTDRDVELLSVTASLVAVAIEHADLFTALADKEAALEALMRRTIDSQEEERRRLATEIHDGVSQKLVSVWYRLNAGERHLAGPDVDRARIELAKAMELVDGALDEARAAIFALRPTTLDDLGLGPSIRALALGSFGEDVALELEIDDRVPLSAHQEVALYRIAQEAVQNVLKHAEATWVKVTLAGKGPDVILRVEDDGNGFDLVAMRAARPRISFGLAGMSERATLLGVDLLVSSRPGEGTAIELRVPGAQGGS
jgi:two-component system, NarL family, sensor kinase